MTESPGRRLSVVALSVVSVALVGFLLTQWLERGRVSHVTIAAGSPTGESYLLAQALKTVMLRHHPNIELSIRETGGTAESLSLLEQGRVEMAAAQADVPVGPAAHLVAVLYEDTFQLLARQGSAIRSVPDLRGKRVALATSGGQYQSFVHVADHFGMKPSDCTFVGTNDDDADRLFLAAGAPQYQRRGCAVGNGPSHGRTTGARARDTRRSPGDPCVAGASEASRHRNWTGSADSPGCPAVLAASSSNC